MYLINRAGSERITRYPEVGATLGSASIPLVVDPSMNC
jgi:hypothetical protein